MDVVLKVGTVAVVALASTAAFGIGWFTVTIPTPLWVLFLFLLTPVGDIQRIVGQVAQLISQRIQLRLDSENPAVRTERKD